MFDWSIKGSSGATGRLNDKFNSDAEESHFKHFYSLLFTESDYVSLFQDAASLSSSSSSINWSSPSTAHSYHPEDTQFFSYEGLVNEAYQHQMQMLIANYQEIDSLLEIVRHAEKSVLEEMNPSAAALLSRNSGSGLNSKDSAPMINEEQKARESKIKAKFEETKEHTGKHNKEKEIHDSIWWKLMSFTQQWSEKDVTTRMAMKKLRCAFGSAAHLIDQDLVMQIIPNVKLFYTEYPEVLEKVKSVVKQNMKSIGLAPEQMHFMYSIN
jgi:hypothetical protein